MTARVAARVAEQITQGLRTLTGTGRHPIVLASPSVRAVVRQLIEASMPTASVLGYNEIVPEIEVESTALIPPLNSAPIGQSTEVAMPVG